MLRFLFCFSTMEAKRGNVEHARDVYKRGIAARCNGMASVWQGLGALEASVGNRDGAREVGLAFAALCSLGLFLLF